MRKLICFVTLMALGFQVDAITFDQAAQNAGYATTANGIIDLENDGVDSLDGASSYTSALKFELSNNSISSLSAGDFSGLSNLLNMELEENPLNALDANVFTGLSGMTQLYLQKNEIVQMDDAAFNGLGTLELLYLRGNEITNISASVFTSLYDTLDTLSLASCKITAIEPGAFAGAFHLDTLYFDKNRITHLNLDEADFPVLTAFRADDMEQTDLVTFSMQEATVSDTALTEILANLSSYPDSLSFVNLSGTVVSNTASLSALGAMDALQTLNLQDTGLTALQVVELIQNHDNLQSNQVVFALDAAIAMDVSDQVILSGWNTQISTDDLFYALPIVDITTSGQTVANDITSIALNGTNSTSVIGSQSWTNALTGGAGTFAASTSWQVASIALSVGDNLITVTGTNDYGEVSSDSITVVREASEPVGYGILSITPATADAGDTGLMVTITLDDSIMLPPSQVQPTAVRIGTVEGTAISRVNNSISATFSIPESTLPDTYDVEVEFPAPPQQGGNLVLDLQNGFEVISTAVAPVITLTEPNAALANSFSNTVVFGTNNEEVVGTATWSNALNGASGQFAIMGTGFIIPNVPLGEGGNKITVTGTNSAGVVATDQVLFGRYPASLDPERSYQIVDTAQTKTFNASSVITAPASNAAFYGQDAQFDGAQPNYIDVGNETILDVNTGLYWQKTADTDGDGDIDADDKLTLSEALAYAESLNEISFAGHNDWRVPDIKELYSLILFNGGDPSSYPGTDDSVLTPFIDDFVFDFAYGDQDANERIIDSQYASTNVYVDNADDANGLLFGVNFADGRIKGYGLVLNLQEKTFFVMCCRGNTDYGVNDFSDNGDGTISDDATGLMWAQNDSGSTQNWENALAYVDGLNASGYLGYSDWRLPNIKELQSILDYTRSPGTTGSAAIDPLFNATSFPNEEGVTDWGYYWSSTTHKSYDEGGASACYMSFGRGLGYMTPAGGDTEEWLDVHGAGCQRSDPKIGSAGYFGPQGDAQRVQNFVRVVRDDVSMDSPVATGPVVFVDGQTPATAQNQDGNSWATAFENLQDALAVSSTQQIWIAQGTYYPDEAAAGYATVTNNDVNATFSMVAGVSIYGGFNGTETNLNQRNIDTQHTILSGDLEQDDMINRDGWVDHDPRENTEGSNSYSVVTVEDIDAGNPTQLDGVLITSGRADYVVQDRRGQGAGIYALNCGGFKLLNTTVIGNVAVNNGGGFFVQSGGSFVISNSVFRANNAFNGGGFYVKWSTPILHSTSFEENAAEDGGGLFCTDADLTVQYCIFMDNEADGGGGAWETHSDSVYENCLFAGNESVDGGGLFDESGTTLLSCTFADNVAFSSGAGVYSKGGTKVRNCLFDNNDVNGVYNILSASFASTTNTSLFAFSNLPGSGGSAAWNGIYGVNEGGNLDLYGQLVGEGNFQLEYSSGAINAGANAYAAGLDTDLLGNARVYDSNVDIGAFETFDDGTDSDLDTLTDYEEGVVYGSDASKADTDGDGTEDADELFVGTDLLDPQSSFRLSLDESSLSWPHTSERSYWVEACTNLSDNSWFPVVETTGSNYVETVDYEEVFYRVNVTVVH